MSTDDRQLQLLNNLLRNRNSKIPDLPDIGQKRWEGLKNQHKKNECNFKDWESAKHFNFKDKCVDKLKVAVTQYGEDRKRDVLWATIKKNPDDFNDLDSQLFDEVLKDEEMGTHAREDNYRDVVKILKKNVRPILQPINTTASNNNPLEDVFGRTLDDLSIKNEKHRHHLSTLTDNVTEYLPDVSEKDLLGKGCGGAAVRGILKKISTLDLS